MKSKEFLPIPCIDDSYSKEFNGFLHHATFYPLIERTEKISEFYFLQYFFEVVTVHWIIRNCFNSKHKIPLTRKELKETEPLGNLYSAVFRACERLHSFTGQNEYRNAAHWFCHILREGAVHGGENAGTKQKSLGKLRRENAMLSSGENPFDCEMYPHTHRLFSLLLTYAPQRGYDRLWKEALAPIKKLRKAWTTAYKSPVYQIGITRDGKEYRQLARSGAGMVERRPIWYWDNNQKKLIFEKPM